MRRLHTAVQKYAWGKKGSESKVAQLKVAENAGFELNEGETYAELWMGTHPNGPSRVVRDQNSTDGPGNSQKQLEGLYGCSSVPGMFLIELLETYPHYLGDQEDIGDLPFMFKVLSIDKALSIQAHPDKKLAEKLYATRPDLYKDDNHKPEMAVALSDFEGLCGFRPFAEIVSHLRRYPELRAMVGAEAVAAAFACTSRVRKDEQKALRAVFRAFVYVKTETAAVQVSALVQRLRRECRRSSPPPTSQHIPRDRPPCRCRCGDNQGNGSNSSNSSNSSSEQDYISRNFGNAKIRANGRCTCQLVDDRCCSDSHDHERVDREGSNGIYKGWKSYNCSNGRRGSQLRRSSLPSACSMAAADTPMYTADGKSGKDEGTGKISHLLPPPIHTKADGLAWRVQTLDINGDSLYNAKTPKCIKHHSAPAVMHSSSAPISASPEAEPCLPESPKWCDRRDAGTAAVGSWSGRRRGSPRFAARRGWSGTALNLSADDHYGRERRAGDDYELQVLMLRLSEEYPGDIGIMMPLLLNYLRMGEGESFFMAANEPHAYLKGDILEVMARSDNVVRVALTPKYRDVPMLCEALTYNMGAPPIVRPVVVDDFSVRYTPPIEDFEMLDIQVPPGHEHTADGIPVASLAIVLGGTGRACDAVGHQQNLCGGVALFVPARTPVVLHSCDRSGYLWVCFARTNLNHVGESQPVEY